MAASARRNWPARFRIDDRKLGGRAETCRESRKTSCDLPVIQEPSQGLTADRISALADHPAKWT